MVPVATKPPASACGRQWGHLKNSFAKSVRTAGRVRRTRSVSPAIYGPSAGRAALTLGPFADKVLVAAANNREGARRLQAEIENFLAAASTQGR